MAFHPKQASNNTDHLEKLFTALTRLISTAIPWQPKQLKTQVSTRFASSDLGYRNIDFLDQDRGD
ncbi:hypothetical protein [Pseudomonas sp. Au-Pse12]|uniref:hypothetical protein n=1 Tax=Pseudomonas sp. Au-Pse12 TaxID=2906459 RepID=UPI001E2BA61A|nr:hypothetical protein [Pseudomonas sp. Au-Pse12]MCE4053237.1 hypothetical protein [Pseudomonas sp. Au-Pse12]